MTDATIVIPWLENVARKAPVLLSLSELFPLSQRIEILVVVEKQFNKIFIPSN